MPGTFNGICPTRLYASIACLHPLSPDGAGRSWKALSAGLPHEYAFIGVYRNGVATGSFDPAGVYIGTNTGKIFTSTDEGNSWDVLADHLPPVYAVSANVRE
jgi:hypothetical protein